MNSRNLLLICLAAVACSVLLHGSPAVSPVAVNRPPSSESSPQLLAGGFQGLAGSTVGPDGALYVTEPATGRILRVNPRTGSTTTFASGLPPSVIGLGGVMDVAFIGRTRICARDAGRVRTSAAAAWSASTAWTVRTSSRSWPTSATSPSRIRRRPPLTCRRDCNTRWRCIDGGFLVTDGHHNRVLQVALNGRCSEVIGFDNIVPTGLAPSGPLVLMAQAGPVPHLPEDGRIVAFLPRFPFALEIASGARLLVDVEAGPVHALYGLSQGEFPVGSPPAAPALPNTGALVKVTHDGTFTVVTSGLNQPTSLEIIGDTAYVVSLAGEIWKIGNVALIRPAERLLGAV